MNSTRPYTMRARARSTELTRRRILAATIGLGGDRPLAEISLGAVAEGAHVSVQTVLRHFGSRDRLLEAAFEQARTEVEEERRAPAGDVAEAVRVVVDHYERRGDGVLVLLAQEHSHELARRITEHGRGLHRRWVTEVFSPQVAAAGDPDTLTDLLVVATDVYTWKLLRRDRGLSRQQTEHRIRHLVSAALTGAG